jgi:benzoyl-CoA reductase/2-hydroxyglutaryl-CoA dehydratase subunit BcrC/BadD/HgdB
MKGEFREILSAMEQGDQTKVRGFNLFLKELFSNLLRAFDEGTKTVYVSGYAFPVELLWAFDVIPFDFEIACNNLPAAGMGQGSSIMKFSEDVGYGRDICSFDRLIIGCQLRGELPKGDLYLTSSYYCHSKAKANEIVARAEGKESVLFDVPNEISPASRKYVVAQLKDIASRLEAATGQSLDLDRLKGCIRSSNRARASLRGVNDLMKNKPCPWDGVRACLLSLAGAIFWGSPIQEQIYALLFQELKDRIEKGAVHPESFRILWSPWVPIQPTNIFTTLKKNGVSIPMTEVAHIWWSEMDENHPFEALAQKALENYMVGPASKRVQSLLGLAEEYQVDGVIHFSTTACHHDNAAFRLISDALWAKGYPVLKLDGDMTDERNYSPQRTSMQLTPFLEMFQSKRNN